MKSLFKKYLFEKHLLVSEGTSEENCFEILFSIANIFNIRINKGAELVEKDMIKFISDQIRINVPEPFYRGFPESVKSLTSEQLLFDQLLHYATTYGLGNFSEAGHSIFEENFERIAFKENADIKEFSIITETEAIAKLSEMVRDLLMSTRPLNDEQYNVVKEFILDYNCKITAISSKNTCIKLLIDTRDMSLVRFLSMSDVIKIVDEINYNVYGNENLKKLNLKNQDRKFIASIMRKLFQNGQVDIRVCYEKKKIWSGLLHHIHYVPKTQDEKVFIDAMRGNKNDSAFSEFERAMSEKNIVAAIDALKTGKGSAAVLRNLNYIISRCETDDDILYAIDSISTKNVVVLLQLLINYNNYKAASDKRTFKFTKHNMLKVHTETPEEHLKCKSRISEDQAKLIIERIYGNLKTLLKDRVGKVYIDPNMKNYALPIQENTSQGGFGSLTRGSRIHIDTNQKKLRAFTYWEKVNDIDLSVFGLTEDGKQHEFSWRTMANNNDKCIVYSGDQTSGYFGGSEYFDVDINKFKARYPDIRYLIFCDNVYSRIPFNRCICRAGYMTRDLEDSGNVYEPKTVKSSFKIDCNSTFAYLFGFDLESNDFIWLNTASSMLCNVAGNTSMEFLLDYFNATNIINVYTFFEMMATELVDDISKADLVVMDKECEIPENVELIREYDFEKMLALINR